MKRIIFFCAAMLAVLTCSAQSVQVLKDGKLIAEFYERDGWEFVFKEQETNPYNGHEYVDLGLPSGIKWATMNVGATKPEEYGDHYAWGEIEPKSYYEWDSYKWCNGSSYTLTKYCTLSIFGTVDNKTTLDFEDDIAHVKWGGDWHIPTKAEWDELIEECTWTWTTLNGVSGRKVTGPNGNSLFFPAAGCRLGVNTHGANAVAYYWSSSVGINAFDAGYIYFDTKDLYSHEDGRETGLSVRAVCP